MNNLEKYNRGLITRTEYLKATGVIDILPDKEIAEMTNLANKHQWLKLVKYTESLKPDEQWMIADIEEMALDCRNLFSDPIKHPQDLTASFKGLLENIKEFKHPVPIAGLAQGTTGNNAESEVGHPSASPTCLNEDLPDILTYENTGIPHPEF